MRTKKQETADKKGTQVSAASAAIVGLANNETGEGCTDQHLLRLLTVLVHDQVHRRQKLFQHNP
jgi:predicted nucleic acid-binding protein